MKSNGRGSRLLRRWTRFTVDYSGYVIVGCLLLTALLGNYAVKNLGVTTDTEDMIAEHLPWRQDFIRFRTEFPHSYRTIVVVISAETEALADRGVRHFNRLLRDLPDRFDDVYSPSTDEPVGGFELLYLDTDDLARFSDSIAEAQPFLGRLRDDYSLPTLFELLAQAVEREAATTPFVARIARSVDAAVQGASRQLDWSRFAGDADPDTPARRLIFLKPYLDFSRPRPARTILEDLSSLGEQTREHYDGRVQVSLTGTIALEDEELVSVTRNAKLTGVIALISVMIILYAAFRDLRLLVCSVVTLLAGLIGTAAFAAWSVGSVNVISVAFAVLYIGLGIDFVIHYLLRVRELAAAGAATGEALETASADVGGSLVICAVTTAAGFYSFVPTSFVGVSQLGLISGTGMFVSLGMTLTLLPALMAVMFKDKLPVGPAARTWGPGARLGRLLGKRWSLVAVPSLIAAGSLLLVPQLRFESDPMLLRDPATPSVQAFKSLSDDSNSTLRVISVVAAPETDVERLKSELSALPSVASANSLSNFRLADVEDKQIFLEDISLMLGESFHRFPELPPADISESRAAIDEILDAIDRSEESLDPVVEDLRHALTSLRSRIENAPPPVRQEVLDRVQETLLGDLPRAMQILDERLAVDVSGANRFPETFVRRWQNDLGDRLIVVLPEQDVSIPDNAERFIADVRKVAPQATGLPVVYHEAGETVIDAFVQAFVYALIAVSVILVYFLRSFRDAALVLIPLGLAAIITGGIAVAIDLPFNFANVIALPLLLGIGVDNGIHMVHRARERQVDAVHLLETSTSRAILFSGLTTLAGFGNLALSSHLGMASMGILLAIGLTMIVLVMIIVLPVLLSRLGS